MTAIPRTPAGQVAITRMIAPPTLPNIPNQPLHPNGPLYITVHETANESPSASALFHANYVNAGGGPGLVSFHFTVDKLGAYQMIPMDRNGWHAADGCNSYEGDLGCFASVAIETCVNDPIGSEGWIKTLGNLNGLICAILSGDNRILWNTAKASRFSADRLRPHHRWSDEGKWCPARILNDKLMDPRTGAGPLAENVKATLGLVPSQPEPEYVVPVNTPEWIGEDVRVGANVWRAIRRTVTAIEDVKPLAFFGPKAPQSGPVVRAGTKLPVEWHVTTGGGKACWVTKQGHRIDSVAVREKVSWS